MPAVSKDCGHGMSPFFQQDRRYTMGNLTPPGLPDLSGWS